MRLMGILKLSTWALGVLAVLVAAAAIAFVPRAKEPGYEFVTAWGGKGFEPGKFDDPTGIAVTANEVFVADSRNNRIQVFDRDGRFKRQFGKAGQGSGELGRPMNLTLHGDELYVPEYFNDRVQVFSLDGTSKRIIGRAGKGPGEFNAPGGVAVADNGDLYVADFYNQRVQHLEADGAFVRQWGETELPGARAGQFIYPTDVTLGSDGTLFVADGYADRVQVFGPDGGFLRKWGGPFAVNIYGPFNGWFATVTSIALDSEGNVFVSDFYNHRVQKFTQDGTFLSSFGKKGNGPGQIDHAMAVAVADDGTAYVTDFINNRIEKWRPKR